MFKHKFFFYNKKINHLSRTLLELKRLEFLLSTNEVNESNKILEENLKTLYRKTNTKVRDEVKLKNY